MKNLFKHQVLAATPAQWGASQQLMDVLIHHRFLEVAEMGVTRQIGSNKFKKGELYYFRKYGECRIGFMKDGRVHVLNGPLSRWELFDSFSDDYLKVLLAFCNLHSEDQHFFRIAMSQYKTIYCVESQLPNYTVDWKERFLAYYHRLFLKSTFAA